MTDLSSAPSDGPVGPEHPVAQADTGSEAEPGKPVAPLPPEPVAVTSTPPESAATDPGTTESNATVATESVTPEAVATVPQEPVATEPVATEQHEPVAAGPVAGEPVAIGATEPVAAALEVAAPVEVGPPHGDAAPRRGYHRGLVGAAIVASYVVLAAATAGAVVAVASPGAVDIAALASPSASASGSLSSSLSPSPSPSPASSSPSPSASPSPVSTVTGSVSNGVHSGDLRYFLLPAPGGASTVQGDPDGTDESLSDVVTAWGGGSQVKTVLQQLGFKRGATRTYQDSSLGANVVIELLQFDSGGDASQWAQSWGAPSDAKSFSIPGESSAVAWAGGSSGAFYVRGIYSEGDTAYQVTVYSDQTVQHGSLIGLMGSEHDRLAHG